MSLKHLRIDEAAVTITAPATLSADQRPRRVAALRSVAFAFVLAVIYAVAAAATFQGYYSKWTMSDEVLSQSLIAMLDGSAERPYIYRQLLPTIANAIEAALPQQLRGGIEERLQNAQRGLYRPDGKDADKDGYVFRYRTVYYLTFVSIFLSLFVLRSIFQSCGINAPAAAATPVLFILMVPILQTRGGYFYDYSELLAFALAARLAIAGKIPLLLLLAAPATLNKESYFFYSLTLLPLLMHRLPFKAAAIVTASSVFVAGATYAFVHQTYAGNPGSTAIFQLFDHLSFYANPLNLLSVDRAYGLPLFGGYSVVTFAWFGILAHYGWKGVPGYIHKHLFLAACINLPLFFVFCADGEMRNLSMLYIAFSVLMAGAVQRWVKHSTAHTP